MPAIGSDLLVATGRGAVHGFTALSASRIGSNELAPRRPKQKAVWVRREWCFDRPAEATAYPSRRRRAAPLERSNDYFGPVGGRICPLRGKDVRWHGPAISRAPLPRPLGRVCAVELVEIQQSGRRTWNGDEAEACSAFFLSRW